MSVGTDIDYGTAERRGRDQACNVGAVVVGVASQCTRPTVNQWLARRHDMRNGQNNKRMRGRNNNNNNGNRRGQNPLTRVYESNGPDIKIRGTASHIAEKYLQLARDARSSSDPVAAENYYQHAEHYFRLIATAQEQFRQNQPQPVRIDSDPREDADEGDGDGFASFGAEPGFAPQPQPREPRPQPSYQPPQPAGQPQPTIAGDDVERLPSFITGAQAAPAGNGGETASRPERYPPRRRRRPAVARTASAQPAVPADEDLTPGE
jgi:hypothetical protein